ncbi:DUF6567 family protein [Hydrotalea sandarakina]|jgi:PBP1b-binding outer membrane lipoprotein LpoB|uniref:Lipoprotein n=1 Tax=Hydrotalea sandarakina TaxID=1004304 RepID=A0A2W7RKF0_9BACT|nr:DUF6567 family protein [Hydrotalea sandarakina]PZX60874.1 hypothetical protein LX80_02358 [Hydrotalea sandarakina]
MLKLKNALFVILIVMLFSSCGMNTALTANLNNNVTNVTLSQKNYKVVGLVTGKAQATYVLGIGGLSHKALVAMAKADMLKQANLMGSARAVVNVTTEENLVQILFPIYFRKEVYVQAHVIEFVGGGQ